MPELDTTPASLAAAAHALSLGARDEARQHLQGIDQTALVSQRARCHQPIWGPDGIARRLTRPVSRPRAHVHKSVKVATFRRDRYICRYAHCQRRAIALPVLKALARGLPDLLCYRPNWKPVSEHILFWLYSASLEHQVGFLHGGTSEPDNLIMACYGCNDLKNWLHADDLGWSVAPPSTDDWDGLEAFIPALRQQGLLTVRDL